MNANAQGDADQVREDLRNVGNEAGNMANAGSEQAKQKIQQARQRAEATLSRVRSRLTDFESEASRRARDMANVTEDYVRENPWPSVFAAAGVGLVLGIVVSLGRRR